MVERKFCRDCDEYRPVSDFSRNARSRDGLAFYCRQHLSERALRSREARRTKPRVNRRPPAGLAVSLGQKWCPDCGSVLPLDRFVKSVASSSGYSAYCKPCHNARSRASREQVGGARSYHLTRRYGITAAEADHLLRQQDGLCAICRTAPAAHVDHDHRTGKVRALLCFNCNGGLGQFHDDPHLLHAAAYYVSLHTARQEIEAEMARARDKAEGASRPGTPPVGSQRRPGPSRSTRGAARSSDRRRNEAAREADG